MTRRRCATGSSPEVRVLVVNAGSSSLKLRLLDPDDEVVWKRDLDPGSAELDAALAEAGQADASGHRIVHGGPRHGAAQRVDDALVEELKDVVEDSLEEAAEAGTREVHLIQEDLHDTIASLVYERLRRRPMILPVVVEV